MKLRTLKDMYDLKGNIYVDEATIYNELRQEAIKEVKDIRNQLRTKKKVNFADEFDLIHKDMMLSEPEAVIDYIMWKNNLTEADLMENKQRSDLK